MCAKVANGRSSILHEILNWSQDNSRPQWQRDALRRIIQNNSLTRNDIDELERMCKSAHGADISSDTLLSSIPLDASHLPAAPGSEQSVSLTAITDINNVNRLASGANITFGSSPGLTIVYGENGAGKSGYARVLKKACRARGDAPTIHQNVFAKITSSKASAKLNAKANRIDCSFDWKDGGPTSVALSNIFVFDSSSAIHYLQQDESAAFTPFGLDILPTLSKICDAVAGKIRDEMQALQLSIDTVTGQFSVSPNTSVGKMISALSARTDEEDLSHASILTEEQKDRITSIKGALDANPIQKAKETRAAAMRLRTFLEKIRIRETDISEAAIDSLRLSFTECESNRNRADQFKKLKFDQTHLAGTGSEEWRALWEVARAFSVAHAYKDLTFPFLGSDALCVLCQSKIDSETAVRLTEFESFCQNKSQQLADESAREKSKRIGILNALTPLMNEFIPVEVDLNIMGNEQQAQVRDYLQTMDDRLAAMKEAVRTDFTAEIPTTGRSVANDIQNSVNFLLDRAKTEESANNPVERKRLQDELSELEAREWLADNIGNIAKQLQRLRRQTNLDAALKDTNTKPITMKNGQLTQHFVTDAYCSTFGRELKKLGLLTLPVKLESIKGRKGETKFGLRLVGAEDAPLQVVASEGEQRCIALAAFMAELSQASHKSALVFDDPVSSLDALYLNRIARRLVEESSERQVIVFTHDVVFLSDLQSYSEEKGVDLCVQYLEWDDGFPGMSHKGLPWALRKPVERFDQIEKETKVLAKSWNAVPNEENKARIRYLYDFLRATLERVVEKEIIGDAVKRFRSYINVKDLKALIGFSQAEYEHLMRLMKKCNDVVAAHDTPSATACAVPPPDELEADIADSKKLVEEIKARQKSVQHSTSSVL